MYKRLEQLRRTGKIAFVLRVKMVPNQLVLYGGGGGGGEWGKANLKILKNEFMLHMSNKILFDLI